MSNVRMSMAGMICLVGVTLVIGGTPPEAKQLSGEQFVILVHETPEEFKLRTDKTEKGRDYWKRWGDFRDEMVAAGVLRGGLPLQQATAARILKIRDGKTEITELPPAKTEWSGFFLIEVRDLEVALQWAAKVPNAGTSHVEVRSGDPIIKSMPKK